MKKIVIVFICLMSSISALAESGCPDQQSRLRNSEPCREDARAFKRKWFDIAKPMNFSGWFGKYYFVNRRDIFQEPGLESNPTVEGKGIRWYHDFIYLDLTQNEPKLGFNSGRPASEWLCDDPSKLLFPKLQHVSGIYLELMSGTLRSRLSVPLSRNESGDWSVTYKNNWDYGPGENQPYERADSTLFRRTLRQSGSFLIIKVEIEKKYGRVLTPTNSYCNYPCSGVKEFEEFDYHLVDIKSDELPLSF